MYTYVDNIMTYCNTTYLHCFFYTCQSLISYLFLFSFSEQHRLVRRRTEPVLPVLDPLQANQAGAPLSQQGNQYK